MVILAVVSNGVYLKGVNEEQPGGWCVIGLGRRVMGAIMSRMRGRPNATGCPVGGNRNRLQMRKGRWYRYRGDRPPPMAENCAGSFGLAALHGGQKRQPGGHR